MYFLLWIFLVAKIFFLIFDILAGTTLYYTERPMKELAKYRILFTNYRPQPEWKPLRIRFKLNIGELYYIYLVVYNIVSG